MHLRLHSVSLKFLLLASMLGILPCHAFARDEPDPLCEKLKPFRDADFEKDAAGLPIRRAFEMHWFGGLIGTLSCIHNGKLEAKKVCAYAMEHTSRENPVVLPLRILECYGSKLPGLSVNYQISRAEIRLQGHTTSNPNDDDDRYSLLEIDAAPISKLDPDGRYAVRFSEIPWKEDAKTPTPRPLLDQHNDDKP